MDKLGTLSIFVQAAEGGSFVAASQRLGLSSSAVGKAIARLEQEMGVRLFHRSTRSMTLTEEGSFFSIPVGAFCLSWTGRRRSFQGPTANLMACCA